MPQGKSNPSMGGPSQEPDEDSLMSLGGGPEHAEATWGVEEYMLPRAVTQRLAKSVLPPNTAIQKDALLAIQRAATVFVSYLSHYANDSLDRTLQPDDVYTGLRAIEIDSFIPRLERELEARLEIMEEKKRATKEKKAAAMAAERPAERGEAAGGGETAAAKLTGGLTGEEEGDTTIRRDAKRVKRDSEAAATAADDTEVDEAVDDDETEEAEEEEEEGEDEDEESDEGDETQEVDENDIDRVEDLDRRDIHPRPDDDDGSDSEDYDEDGPGAQLRQNLGLG